MAAPTVLAVQQSPAFAKGVAVTAQAVDAVNGNVFANDGRTSLRVNNGSASPITVTFTLASSTRNGLGAFGLTEVVSIPATTEMDFGLLEVGTFNNAGGQAQFLCSASVTVTAKVVQLLATPV